MRPGLDVETTEDPRDDPTLGHPCDPRHRHRQVVPGDGVPTDAGPVNITEGRHGEIT